MNKSTNKSSFYLLPLTFIPKQYFDKNIGVYCRAEEDKIDDEYCNRIYVLFNKSDVDLDNIISKSPTFLKTIDIDQNYIIFVFRILPAFLDDFSYFLRGKYSKFTKEFKELIVNYHDIKVDIVLPSLYELPYIRAEAVYFTINPQGSNKLEKANELGVDSDTINEIASKPDLKKETFYRSKLFDLKL